MFLRDVLLQEFATVDCRYIPEVIQYKRVRCNRFVSLKWRICRSTETDLSQREKLADKQEEIEDLIDRAALIQRSKLV